MDERTEITHGSGTVPAKPIAPTMIPLMLKAGACGEEILEISGAPLHDLLTPTQTKLTVIDMLGRVAATLGGECQQAGSGSVALQVSNLLRGVYFYRLRIDTVTEFKRFSLPG